MCVPLSSWSTNCFRSTGTYKGCRCCAVGNAVERLRLEWRLGLFSIAASLLLLRDGLQDRAARTLARLGLALPPPAAALPAGPMKLAHS